jgi:hypothetical protein
MEREGNGCGANKNVVCLGFYADLCGRGFQPLLKDTGTENGAGERVTGSSVDYGEWGTRYERGTAAERITTFCVSVSTWILSPSARIKTLSVLDSCAELEL